MFKTAPLSSGMMLTSMLGFIVCAFFLTHPVLMSWAWAFIIVFTIMFIACIISMSNTPIGNEEALKRLAIHNEGHYKKKK